MTGDGGIPTWEVIKADFIDPGLPCMFVLRPEPRVALFVDQEAARFGALFALPAAASNLRNPLVELSVKQVLENGVVHLEIATSSRQLYREVYLFLVELISLVLTQNITPILAFGAAVKRWQDLFKLVSLLDEPRQIGLLGELWLLDRIARRDKVMALTSWVGPRAQTHDFRLANVEFEVKSTFTASRQHHINGLDQLDASAGCDLFLLSMHFIEAGAGGETLPEVIARLKIHWSDDETLLSQFQMLLESSRYFERSADQYTKKFRLGSLPTLIRVDDSFPRFTRETIRQAFGERSASRISRVDYKVDVDGLGVADGTDEFLLQIP